MSGNQTNQENKITTKTLVSFGVAVDLLKMGRKVARVGWNGKGLWLVLVPSCSYDVASGLCDTTFDKSANPTLLPFIAMKTADNGLVPWLASQTDVLSEDWDLVS